MTKLHAQMALFGTIDDIVRKTDDLEIVTTVEKFLPGLTGFGKRGWFGELKQFMARPELAPTQDPDSDPGTRTAADMFPDLTAAVAELGEVSSAPQPLPQTEPRSSPAPPPRTPNPEPPPAEDIQTPTDVARTILAATVLSKVARHPREEPRPHDSRSRLPCDS